MTRPYRIFGSEMSPYSVKVRSYLRYKGLPHQWLSRSADPAGEYQQRAKLPIVPLVVTPDDVALQDSTPIIDHIEADHPSPSIHPQDSTLRFLSLLIEEFGDEWGNKWMFHYRWARELDQDSAAVRIALSAAPGMDEDAWRTLARQIRERMVGRVWFVGSSAENAPFIEANFLASILQYDAHLAGRPYLFGARPAYADFGLWGQLYTAWTDPTAGAIIQTRAPNLLEWIQRMLFPVVHGEFETWGTLAATLAPILRDQIGNVFLPWTVANAAAVSAGHEGFSIALDNHVWVQKPQKYHAKSLQVLRERYAAIPDPTSLDASLSDVACLWPFRP